MHKTSLTTPCTSRIVGKSTTSSPLITSTSSSKSTTTKIGSSKPTTPSKNTTSILSRQLRHQINIDILDIKHFASFRHLAFNIDIGDYIAERGFNISISDHYLLIFNIFDHYLVNNDAYIYIEFSDTSFAITSFIASSTIITSSTLALVCINAFHQASLQ